MCVNWTGMFGSCSSHANIFPQPSDMKQIKKNKHAYKEMSGGQLSL